jgi:hypothetical protein
MIYLVLVFILAFFLFSIIAFSINHEARKKEEGWNWDENPHKKNNGPWDIWEVLR